jgi:hypothetical protein
MGKHSTGVVRARLVSATGPQRLLVLGADACDVEGLRELSE